MKLYYKLEKKYGKYAIPGLMKYITVLYAAGFIIALVAPELYAYLTLDMRYVFQGQIWRLFTFIMSPPTYSLIFLPFVLYFYYMIGTMLERFWGTFRFNLYYLSGVIFHIIAGLILYLVWGLDIQLSTNYINMSMFLAYAMILPDMQVLLFFLIPIKIKWIAYLDMAYLAAIVLVGIFSRVIPYRILMAFGFLGIGPADAIMVLLSIMNFIIFMMTGPKMRRMAPKEVMRRAEYKRKVNVSNKPNIHRCAVCGRTDADDSTLVFRYCSKCEGDFEYCNEHLYTHKHVINDANVKQD